MAVAGMSGPSTCDSGVGDKGSPLFPVPTPTLTPSGWHRMISLYVLTTVEQLLRHHLVQNSTSFISPVPCRASICPCRVPINLLSALTPNLPPHRRRVSPTHIRCSRWLPSSFQMESQLQGSDPHVDCISPNLSFLRRDPLPNSTLTSRHTPTFRITPCVTVGPTLNFAGSQSQTRKEWG